nr:hypothetical protein [uncultured Desulfobulbus sp.]
MKVELGIFQEQQRIDEYLASKGIAHTDIVVAGPFASHLQATQWMDFMEEKLGKGKVKRHSIGLMNKQPWYGLAFEKGEYHQCAA